MVARVLGAKYNVTAVFQPARALAVAGQNQLIISLMLLT